MKSRISATVDNETVRIINKLLQDKNSIYRNKSHVIEDSIRFLEQKIKDKNKEKK